MLKYGCSGVSSWKNADMDILLHLDFCPMANLRPKRKPVFGRQEDWRKGRFEFWSPSETSDIGFRAEPLIISKKGKVCLLIPKEKGKSGCYWSPSRTPDEPPGVVSSPTNELHRLFLFPLGFPASVLLKHAELKGNELNVKHSAQGSTEDWHS